MHAGDLHAPDLGDHLNTLMQRVPRAALAEAVARAKADCLRAGVWFEKDGERYAVPFAMRPGLMDLMNRGYVHHAAWQVRLGLRRLARLRREDPAVARVLPVSDIEQDWLDRYRRDNLANRLRERAFCRLDALGHFDGTGWRTTLRFVEANVAGVGGLTYTPAVERALLDHIVPLLTDLDPELFVEVSGDPRALLLADLVDHARLMGATGRVMIAFVDDFGLYALGGELGRLAEWACTQGVDAVYVDVKHLEAAPNGDVFASGRRIDVVYRFLELSELSTLEAEGADLRGLRAAFARGIVVPSVVGDLEHKSLFEVLTSARFAGHFTPAQLRVFADHVLWTRLLDERRTETPSGEEVDLVPWARRSRTSLVVKPNRGFAGQGIVLGPQCDEAAWQRAIDEAMAVPGTCVVQALAAPERADFAEVADDGSVRIAPKYTAGGFFPGLQGLGVFGRYSDSAIVNVSRGGGILPFLSNVL
jgi:hypothetical protein